MVAWRLVLSTPEFPKGREMVIIANDLTFFIGSFGPREDLLFNKASELARERKVPRVCIRVQQTIIRLYMIFVYFCRSMCPVTVEHVLA